MAVFAVIPAAGLARRMGMPKLSLPLGSRTVLEHVLAALAQTTLKRTVVVLGPTSAGLATLIGPPAEALLVPADTPEMRRTIAAGLDFIEANDAPQPTDAFLLVLGDQPSVQPALVAELLCRQSMDPTRIYVPTFQGRRGHPVLFPWALVPVLRGLPPDRGLNELLKQRPESICELPVEDPTILEDLDDPEDYARLRARAWP